MADSKINQQNEKESTVAAQVLHHRNIDQDPSHRTNNPSGD